MKRILLISIILSSAFGLYSQTKVVYGKLTAFNRYPVQNITVISKKAKSSVVTDSLGQYRIVCNKKDVIKTESDVFVNISIRVGKSEDTIKEMNLIFIDNPKNRELATGYGYISEKDLTYAVSHLEYENNDFCNYSDVYDLFSGRFAGVTVQNDGSGKGIFIRGISSINLSSEALYVVDGIIYESIDHISPCEVKSIDVLKDGAASMYGVRGANGVVIIETKGYI